MTWKPGILETFRAVRLNAQLYPVGDFEVELYRKYGLNFTEAEAHTPKEILSYAADSDAILGISMSLPKEVIENLTCCRVISRIGAGMDKIDVAAATRKGIVVANVPYFCIEEQADHTMALLLALARKLPKMIAAMKEGAWAASRHLAIGNRRLTSRVLGLVGFGGSARAVARRALAFGMRVIATRRRMDDPPQEAKTLGVQIVPLDMLLHESDYVSLHVPLNGETRHLMDASRLAQMKPEAYLINTARGAIVDETALADFLREGKIAGAALDTFEFIDLFGEAEGPPDHPLLSLDNVILTPHVASYSVESRRDANRGGIENAVSVLNGHWPQPENLVNGEVVPSFPLADHDHSLFA